MADETSASPVPREDIDAGLLARLRECVASLETDRKAVAGDVAGDGSEWRVESDAAPGVSSVSRPMEGTNLRKYRAIGTIAATPKEVRDLLWIGPERMAWDITYESIDDRVIFTGAAANEDPRLGRLALRPVLILSPRDFVMLKMCVDHGAQGAHHSYSAVALSIVDDARVPEVEGYVRADVCPGSGWHAEPAVQDDGSVHCKLTYVIMTDIKGWVPQALVNTAVNSTFSKYYTCLAARVEELKAKAKK
jgi:hypothetical protein